MAITKRAFIGPDFPPGARRGIAWNFWSITGPGVRRPAAVLVNVSQWRISLLENNCLPDGSLAEPNQSTGGAESRCFHIVKIHPFGHLFPAIVSTIPHHLTPPTSHPSRGDYSHLAPREIQDSE